MASQQISLGIGSPADIPNFLTFGLFPVDDGEPADPIHLCNPRMVPLTGSRTTRSLTPRYRTVAVDGHRDTKDLC